MKKIREDFELEQEGDQFISIMPIDTDEDCTVEQKTLLEMQLLMATSSVNHEYARMAFEDADCPEKREELLEYMNDCRIQYFLARENLERFNPGAVEEFEEDLIRQKQAMLNGYHA